MRCHVARRRYWVSVAVLSIAAGGCFPDDHDAAASPPSSAGRQGAVSQDGAVEAGAASLARRIAFSPCAEDPQLECGQLSVPVDYEDPQGPQIAVAVARVPALTRRKKGVVFVNPGGPGGSGVNLLIFAR